MKNFAIIVTRSAKGYAEELVRAPFNVENALDKVAYYAHAEAARLDFVEEEVAPWETVTTGATLLIRANSYNPEGIVRIEVPRAIAALGGDKEAQARAVAAGMEALNEVLNDSAVYSVGINLDEFGNEYDDSEGFPTVEEDEDDYEEYYPQTLRDINRQQIATDEAWTASAALMQANGFVYKLETLEDADNLGTVELLNIFQTVREHLERLADVPYNMPSRFEDCTAKHVFQIYKELKTYLAG